MKTSIAIRLVAALLSAATVAALELPIPTPSEQLSTSPEATTAPEVLNGGELGKLDLRQATAINNAATQNPLQYPSITTAWPATLVNGVTTYLPVVYTQTFAAIPDQWPSPQVGQIGLGTLSKEKRDAVPEPTVYLIPMEMVLQTVNVVVPITPVLEVEVIEPLTAATISLVSELPSSTLPLPTGSPPRQSGIFGTASSVGYNSSLNGSTGASRSFMAGFTAAAAWNST